MYRCLLSSSPHSLSFPVIQENIKKGIEKMGRVRCKSHMFNGMNDNGTNIFQHMIVSSISQRCTNQGKGAVRKKRELVTVREREKLCKPWHDWRLALWRETKREKNTRSLQSSRNSDYPCPLIILWSTIQEKMEIQCKPDRNHMEW